MHEDVKRQHAFRTASPRAFGLMTTAVLALIALQPLLAHGAPRWWVMAVAVAALVLAIFAPSIYGLPNRLWMKLGALLARIVSPLALALLFYGVFMPTGWLMRRAGRRPLRLAFERDAPTYWIERRPPGPEGASLKHPF